jgi:nicotinate phosphoribosyltransferase
MVEAKKD